MAVDPYSGGGTRVTPGHPTGRKPPGWRPPNRSTTQPRPGDITVTRNGGGYITVGPDMFGQARAVSNTMSAEDALNVWIAGAGIDQLGVPTNWWPGMFVPNLDSLESAPGMWREGPSLEEAEPWRDEGTLFQFKNEDTGKVFTQYVRYDPSQAARQYMLMGDTERAKFSQMLADAGYLDEEWGGISDFHPEAASAFMEALSWANYYGTSVEAVLSQQGKFMAKMNSRRGGGGGGGGGGGPQVKIEVPDYETLVTNAKAMIRKTLGRDPADWEMTLVADEMQRQYGRWAEATRQRIVGGNGTYEIPDPDALSQEFVEDQYADEISRLEDVGNQTQTNQLLIGAATRGTQMMGGPMAGMSGQ